MLKLSFYYIFLSLLLCSNTIFCQQTKDWKGYSSIIRSSISKDYKGMLKPAGGALKYPFITPGSSQYSDDLWDWDSWLSNIALRQILIDIGTEKDKKMILDYEQGCILNFLSFSSIDGWIPIVINKKSDLSKIKPQNIYEENMHKPCLAQHAAFLVQQNNENAEWLREKFYYLQTFVDNYVNHAKDKATGLYYWQSDNSIGVDNDPSIFYRPDKSSGSIFLNCMMYKELNAMVYLCKKLDFGETAMQYNQNAIDLKEAIQKNCWDEKDGFYYSVDLNLKPINKDTSWSRHSGSPRNWDCLIQRIGGWSGFLAMWSDIATTEQSKRMVEENYNNTATFNAPAGIRTLSKLEKMYNLKASGNPSSWLGPVWGISNYLTWRGLVKYGYIKEAQELAIKTIIMFGRDLEKNGTLHEYYQPENGEPILNPGFQNWNYLVLNMLDWMEDKKVISEF